VYNTGHFDYLIVGQGLAGTCLGHCLESKFKRKIFVVDRDSGRDCSRIAVGGFNPLVFKTFTPTWKSLEFIPFLYEFYKGFGDEYHIEMISENPVLKTLKGEDQRRLWENKSTSEPSSFFMDDRIRGSIDGTVGPYGFGAVKQSGNINMVGMLDEYRHHLKLNNQLLEQSFDYSLLEYKEGNIEYNGIKADKIVFCLGHNNTENPFFKYLPFKLTKGEALVIKVPNWNPDGIVHNKINIVPMGEDLFWVGSTFSWDEIDTIPSQTGKFYLLKRIKETLTMDFEVVDHMAGIRPTVKDRRPLLGEHPKFKNVFVFNGIGTRGVMLAPYFANELAEHMENGKELEREVHIRRFSELK